MSQMLLRLAQPLDALLGRGLHTSAAVCGSVFMKRQKKVDPEVAKVREQRKRRKLEKEIRQMQKHSKKPKPVEELAIDIQSAKNLSERITIPPTLSESEQDQRALILKDYTRYCHELRRADDAWLARSVRAQESALAELKRLSPVIYEAAIQPDTNLLPFKSYGPVITPPIKGYVSPDGDYVDTTRTWT